MHFIHTLYFIRHGETDWNRAGRLQGQTETNLNALGRTQAARNGETLCNYLDHIEVKADTLTFVSSPLRRTRETAEIVREKLGLNRDRFPTDDRLKEISFGQFEGLSPADIKSLHPDEHAKRKSDRWGHAAPDGESYHDLSKRVKGWLASVDEDMIVVAHGGISRVLRGHLLGLEANEIMGLAVPQDQIMMIGQQKIDWL